MAIRKVDRAKQRRFRSLRLTVLVVVLAISTALGLLHQLARNTRPVSVDALDPFGGIESAITLILTGTMIQRIAWTSFVLLLATVLVALLFRRAFCGSICALGALQELFGRLGRRLFHRKLKVPARIDRPARYLKYLVLVVVVAVTAATGELFIRPYDPWAAYHHLLSSELISGFLVGLIALVVSLVGSMFYDRFFCRYLCPMGAFLGLINRAGLFRVQRNNDTCTHCMACNRACPVDIKVESMAQVQTSECINCNLCVVACPVPNTLMVGRGKRIPRNTVVAPATSKQPGGTHRLRVASPKSILIATVLTFSAVVTVSTVVGRVEWTMKPLETLVEEKKKFDPADIKGTDTFATVSQLSGVPKEDFMVEFNLKDKDFVSPIRDAAHASGSSFDTQDVRDFVASRLTGR